MKENDIKANYQSEKVWDPVIRIWHWLLVLTVVSGWWLGENRSFSLMQYHLYLGYSTGVLLLIRIFWGLVGPASVRFRALWVTPSALKTYLGRIMQRRPSGVRGHNPVGALSVIAMLLMLATQVISGLFSEETDLYFEGPLAWTLSESGRQTMGWIHHQTSELLLVIVGLHVAAILFYLFWKRENLVKAMFSGWKLVKKQRD